MTRIDWGFIGPRLYELWADKKTIEAICVVLSREYPQFQFNRKAITEAARRRGLILGKKAAQRFAWPEAARRRVKDLWKQGYTASQAAEKINSEFGCQITRCSVIGIIRRMDDPDLPPRRRKTSAKKPKGPKLKPRPLPPEPAPILQSKPVDIMGLTGTTCRWPIGDPLEEGFHFCGADCQPERSYCAYHTSLATRRPLTGRAKQLYREARARERWVTGQAVVG